MKRIFYDILSNESQGQDLLSLGIDVTQLIQWELTPNPYFKPSWVWVGEKNKLHEYYLWKGSQSSHYFQSIRGFDVLIDATPNLLKSIIDSTGQPIQKSNGSIFNRESRKPSLLKCFFHPQGLPSFRNHKLSQKEKFDHQEISKIGAKRLGKEMKFRFTPSPGLKLEG